MVTQDFKVLSGQNDSVVRVFREASIRRMTNSSNSSRTHEGKSVRGRAIAFWQVELITKAVIGQVRRSLTIGVILLNRLIMPVALPDNDR